LCGLKKHDPRRNRPPLSIRDARRADGRVGRGDVCGGVAVADGREAVSELDPRALEAAARATGQRSRADCIQQYRGRDRPKPCTSYLLAVIAKQREEPSDRPTMGTIQSAPEIEKTDTRQDTFRRGSENRSTSRIAGLSSLISIQSDTQSTHVAVRRHKFRVIRKWKRRSPAGSGVVVEVMATERLRLSDTASAFEDQPAPPAAQEKK